MGAVFRHKVKFCTACNRRLDKTVQQEACSAAGHEIEVRELPTFWIKYYENGKPKYESTKSEKKKEAEKLLRKREKAVDDGIPIDPKRGLIRFDEAVELLLTDFTLNDQSTHDDVKGRVELHLTPVFGGRRMASIRSDEIATYQKARRKEEASNGTINRELALLRRMFNLALANAKLSRDHVPQITMLKEDNVRQGFFEEHEYRSVLKKLPEQMRPVATFAYITGWRTPSEVLTLEWRQVDFKLGQVRLDPGTTKNKEGRVFPFTTDLRTLLEEQQQLAKQVQKGMGKIPRHVFFHVVKMKDGSFGKKTGNPVTESGYNKAWRAARRLAGCPGRIPHDFRRTAVRRLEQAGVPRSVAMKLTGHKTEAVYRRYAIVSEGDLRDAVTRLDGYTNGYTRAPQQHGARQRTQNP
jgi:integrase